MPEPKKIVLASGKIRYRAVIGIGKYENGKRRQLTITKDTAKEVKAEISRIENEQNTGSFVPPHLLTVNQWIDQWLEKKAEDLEETTVYNYRTTLDRVRGKLGNIKLQELTEEDVEAWMLWSLKFGRVRGDKVGTPLGVTSVDMSLARLKDVLNRAVTKRLVQVNVASEISIPRKARKVERKAKGKLEPWNVKEVHAFVQGISGDRLYAPLLLSLMGLRPAEVCGLRWADIDLADDTLIVANTRTMMGNKTVIEKDTKSMAGERVLPLPAPVKEALKRFKALQAAEKLALGTGYADVGYMCVNVAGEVHTTKQLRTRAYKLMADIGLRQVRLYDARASCFTYLANNGVPDHLLARWAGHTNVKTTKRWYVKPDVEDLRGAATTWGGLHSAQEGGV
ncbi:site-specific integrase [Streptomyces sp. SID3915]|uniref:tyrosine-type recombinase/integrase n=1 Tax=Streptomyces sp. SID3915 TaxID=2690263 RepID=UPI001370662F|nr:site-specific integrase [Streptomyces sp. SID3915]MYX76456.1 tyrosine-type recombinase/integrase [Streptomyces sp. SID3915]